MRDASDYARNPRLAATPPAERVLHMQWLAPVPLDTVLSAKTAPASLAVQAVGNHGRWIAECPDCHGAQLTSADDRRFMCNECANVAIGGLWRQVLWPSDPVGIADALAARPTENRNWSPGETPAGLRAENAAHGLPEVVRR